MNNFDPENYQSCVNRAMRLIKNREEQARNDGHQWHINTLSCRWAIEQEIINRPGGETMMAAAIRYVEKVERQFCEFNGIDCE